MRREKLRPGTWDAGQAGPVAGGAVSSCVGGEGGLSRGRRGSGGVDDPRWAEEDLGA